MATLARMHVELIAKGDRYERDIKKAKTMTERLRDEMTKTRSVVGLLAGAAGFGLAAKAAFDLGSAVEETGSKFRTVFGESTTEVQKFIDQFGTLAGLSNEQAQGVLATTGSIVQGMGFAQEASARFSTQVVQLAGDLSSFNNIPIAETSMAIQAALTGEREQLKRLGIVLREADVQQRALAIAGGNATVAALDQTRATATLQLITERAGVAIGDLARTQDSAANRARALKAEFRNMAEAVSVGLLPVMASALEKTFAFISGMRILVAEFKVGIATLKFWKEQWFGTEETMLAAEVAMEQAILDMVWLKDEIGQTAAGLLDLNGGLGQAGSGFNNLAGATNTTATALQIANVPFREMSVALPGITTGVNGLAMAHHGLAAATNAAASAQNRLNDAMGKAQGFLGALGSLGSAFKFAIPGLGQASGLLSAFQGFKGLFADGGHIAAGGWGIVGERGPEIVSGPANVTPMGAGGDSVTNIYFMTPDGRQVSDTITFRQKRGDNLNRVARLPVQVAAGV